MADDPDRLQRFENEAKVAAGLNHPGIVTLYTLEEDSGTRFLTMELVEGKTLKQSIEDGETGAERGGAVAVELADALGAAHAGGITHRDLKPANIMLTKDRRVKVLDFGLARLHEAAGQTDDDETLQQMTVAGMIMGTIGYMSPEQALGRPADHRSDVFSVGIVLYELVTGTHPFPASNAAGQLAMLLRDTPPPIASRCPEIPVQLGRAIDRCLCQDPDCRFQTAGDLLDALRGEQITLDAGEADRLKSVAVLPFKDQSQQRDQEYFCDGLADELIDELTKLEGLRVASKTSAQRFKDHAEDVRKIGEQLSVESVLEGSLRTAGDRMRVSVQFTSARDGYLLWSGKFDRVFDDLFAAQGDIAHRVVQALEHELSD
jgi:serine/threonine protein kinase